MSSPWTSFRRNIEELGPGAYDEMSYYQRWMASIGNNLLEKGVIGVDELGRKMAEVEAKIAGDEGRMSIRFRPGDQVRVRKAHPPGHVRTPFYIRGHDGVVESVAGDFADP